jgi:hypothetical protein
MPRKGQTPPATHGADQERIPVPLQALMALFVPAFVTIGAQLVWAVANWSDPPEWNAWLALIPAFAVGFGTIAQYRFIRRAMAVGMIDATASPAVITALTVAGAIAGTLIVAWLPGDLATTGSRERGRSRIGFAEFMGLFTLWLSACAGILLSRARSRGPSAG